MINTFPMSGRRIFADTSGFIALMDADDAFHEKAANTWKECGVQDCSLLTSNYVRLESWALIRRRLGFQAALDFTDLILPSCSILQVGELGFNSSVNEWRRARRRSLSLVDITSFHLMRSNEITKAFSFDGHFSEEGFEIPK